MLQGLMGFAVRHRNLPSNLLSLKLVIRLLERRPGAIPSGCCFLRAGDAAARCAMWHDIETWSAHTSAEVLLVILGTGLYGLRFG